VIKIQTNNIHKKKIIYIGNNKFKLSIDSIDGWELTQIIWDEASRRNLHDFDILLLNFPQELPRNSLRYIENLKLTNNDNRIFIIFSNNCHQKINNFFVSNRIQKDSIHRIWKFIPKTQYKRGSSIILERNLHPYLQNLFDDNSNKIYWRWSVRKQDLPYKAEIFARNREKQVISFSFKENMNYFILLPKFKNIQSVIQKLMSNFEEFSIFLNDTNKPINSNNEVIEPKWIQDYDKFNKIKLQKQISSDKNKLKKISTYEKLLYAHGKQLEKAIRNSLEKLEFNIIKTSSEREDIVFGWQNTRFVAEIKGLKGIAKEKNISQLFKWELEYLPERELSKDLTYKFIFICNSEREIIPSERTNPFDINVINKALGNNWGLLSSHELFKAMYAIENNLITQKELRHIIMTTQGEISLISEEISGFYDK
jgi:hypothetical protein